MALYFVDVESIAFQAAVREQGRFPVLNLRPEYLGFTRLVVVFALAFRSLVSVRPLLCIGSSMLHDYLLTLMLLSLPIRNLQPSICFILLLLLHLLLDNL